MSSRNKRVIFWTTEVFNLINGKPIGGIAVQMYFWAKTFAKNGWEVTSFAKNTKSTSFKEGIYFIPKRNIQKLNLIMEWWNAFKCLLKERPSLIVYRGANRELLPLSIFSRLFGAKLVYFSASDVNFEPGKELVGSELNRKMYHRSLRNIHKIVVQNNHQHDTLLANYGKESLLLFNIWSPLIGIEIEEEIKSDAVWVANFRKLKRAEWVLDMAKVLPQYHFTLAGGPYSSDISYYEKMQVIASKMKNVSFLGPKSFFFTNNLVSSSKILLCTSTFEGFPNTFLQAWSNGLPIITTVDPSDIIRENNLGLVVKTEDELEEALQTLLNNPDKYKEIQHSVNSYFKRYHSNDKGYTRLMNYIYEKN